jgi:hypothetical protein
MQACFIPVINGSSVVSSLLQLTAKSIIQFILILDVLWLLVYVVVDPLEVHA